ncbi:hypothetical protein KFL_001760090 [Klebsormidium nitens]|uniref:Uncharacterized protein n=1 Tax=Klebsormidium nitens TaxID=105231 RepID=A0A1Y1HZJ7_KLENI|nr:hypothetical protein KFL_001760090 [Klebsormidium nitens]|eukprot:GAQ84100.1 hypothetical protein KFL_001760090 [Klebsormidium nitens]
MELLDQLLRSTLRPSSVQTNRRKLAHATAALKWVSVTGGSEEVFRRPLEEVLETSTSGTSRGPFTTRHVAPPRRHSGTSKKDEEDEIMSSLMRTRRWSSPETRRTRWGGTISSKKGRGGVDKQEQNKKNGSFLPPLNRGKVDVDNFERGRVKKAWSEKGSVKGVGKGSGVRSPLATLSNFRGDVHTNRASEKVTLSKMGRNETAKTETDRVNSKTRNGASKQESPEPNGKKEGEPCECNNCLECILRPRRRRGRPTDRSMMVTLSLPDDERWAIQETGIEEDGSTEWGHSEGYSDESGGSSRDWSESDFEAEAETETGRKKSWVERPLTLEELESEAPMEEYHREKLELWFRSRPEAEAEDPAHEAVVHDIRWMFRRNPLMRPGKATRETFRRLASPREASEQMDKEEAALLALASQQQRKRALRAYIRKERAEAAERLARRREKEERARAQAREEEERRATLRRLVGGYVAVEARRKLREYQGEQQKRLQKAAELRQNPATWHQ